MQEQDRGTSFQGEVPAVASERCGVREHALSQHASECVPICVLVYEPGPLLGPDFRSPPSAAAKS